MNSIPQNIRYLPHTLYTRYHAVKTYRNGTSVAFICRRYKISKASLMRWNKRFDGSKESLRDKSHRPLTPHPNSHTNEEINWIRQCIRRNPKATLIEIFYKLKTNKDYHRHPCSLFRILRKLGFFKPSKEKKRKKSTNQNPTIRRPKSESNGKWMSNMSQNTVTLALSLINSISILSSTKLPESDLSILLRSKALILQFNF